MKQVKLDESKYKKHGCRNFQVTCYAKNGVYREVCDSCGCLFQRWTKSDRPQLTIYSRLMERTDYEGTAKNSGSV